MLKCSAYITSQKINTKLYDRLATNQRTERSGKLHR